MAQNTDRKGGSAEEVALELMREIARHESVKVDRKYYLTLYRQCLKATSGQDLESILKAD